MITDPWFFAAAIPAVLLAGISKGGFGGGVALMAVPLISLTVPVTTAATIMLPVLICIDFITVGVYRKSFSKPDLAYLLPGAVIGTALGWLGFQIMTDAALRLLVGLLALAFTLDHWLKIRPKKAVPQAGFGGVVWGSVAGFTSFFAHAGGPPVSVYLLPRQLDKRLFVGTIAIFFWLVNLMKLPAYWQLDQFSNDVLMASLVLAPIGAGSIWLGLYLQKRLSDQLFYGICYFLLFLTGCKLCFDGITGLI